MKYKVYYHECGDKPWGLADVKTMVIGVGFVPYKSNVWLVKCMKDRMPAGATFLRAEKAKKPSKQAVV